MDNEKEKNQNIDDKDDKFFEDLLEVDLDDDDVEDENDGDGDNKEDRSQKNRDAEEARKRREAEAKAKAEEEAKKKAEEEAKAKAEEEAKAKAEMDAKKKGDQTSKLGGQLVDFKKKYPDVELVELDNDKSFKKFIEGKLLGKKDFTQLYEEYLEIRSELSGKSQDEVKRNYERKANSSSGSAIPRGSDNPTDVYSEEELEKITKRLPYMSDAEANKVMSKFDKSIEFYKSKNKK